MDVKCACGCGQKVTSKGKRYIRWHHVRHKTPEHIAHVLAKLPLAWAAPNPRATGKKIHNKDSRKRLSERWKGAGNPNWVASGEFVQNGRVYLRQRDGSWKLRAHIVAEKKIGRPLKHRKSKRGRPQIEIVHHINEDKLNDKPNNLLVCTDSEYRAIHAHLNYIRRKGLWKGVAK